MSERKSDQKSRILKRSSRSDKNKNESKEEKEKVKMATKAIASDDKYRSGSLNRGRASTYQESPRKSQSVDRRPSYKDSSSFNSSQKNARTSKAIAASTKTNSSSINKKSSSSQKVGDTDKKEIRRSRGPVKSLSVSNSLQKSKTTERRTNAQIAKSFVQNTSKKPAKHLESQKAVSILKESKKQKNSVKNEESSSVERPRTSTIRKGTSEAPDDLNSEENEGKLKNNALSRSKMSLNVESDDEKASYEDDFEDYNSDFEDSDTESASDTNTSYSSMEEQDSPEDFKAENFDLSSLTTEVSEIPSLVKSNTESLENKHIAEKAFLRMSDRSSLNPERNNEKPVNRNPVKISRSFINFASAVEKEEEKIKLNKSMNNSTIEPPDISPDPADVLTITFGNYRSSNTKQAYVQTENYDAEETQTDEIEVVDKWTQNPLNGTLGYGGEKILPVADKTSNWKQLFNPHSIKLSSFLQRSSHVMLTLLDEEFSSNKSEYITNKRQDFFQSCGYYLLPSVGFLKDNSISNICSTSASTPYIFTIYGNMVKLPSPVNIDEEKGIICVWNVLNSKKPEYILMANSQPICGTFGPGGSSIVIAGMVDGTVMLWDLSDIRSNVSLIEVEDESPLLSSTYNTALIFGTENHNSCIIGIKSVCNETAASWKLSSSLKQSYTKNFHVLTLDDIGVINVWVVVEVLKPDISGTESDLGLAPGGKFRLVKSSTIPLHTLSTLHMKQNVNIRTFDFRIAPFDSSQIFITTDSGIVLHVNRHGGLMEPRYYSSEIEYATEVRSIDFSPHNQDLFLICCSDGSMKLFNIKIARPIIEFLYTEKGEFMNHVQWSTIHPTIFFVLSSSSSIHLWNFRQDTLHPVQSYHFPDCKITWFILQTPEKSATQPENEKYSNLLLSKENGDIEVHTFHEKITNEDYEQEINFMNML